MAATGVRIAGVGLASAFGAGVDRAVEALRAGRAEVHRPAGIPLPFPDRIRVSQLDRTAFPLDEPGTEALVRRVVEEALAQAAAPHLDDCALVIGTSGLLFAAEEDYRRALAASGRADPPALAPPGRLAARLARQLGIRGPVHTLSTACSSSANALLVGLDLISAGKTRRALVLGVEGLSAITLGGFFSLALLDPEGCRPFDANRRGLQLGEGMAALLLEAAEAGAPGSRLAGGANLCDIHHVTSATPDGRAMRRVMQDALDAAGISPEDIVAIKAHGTGSQDNDAAEAAAMRGLFGEKVPPFTGLKRYLGHTLAACGAIETAVFASCLRAGFIPPTAGFRERDEELSVTPLTDFLTPASGHYLLNFFGFGGNYASLVIAHGPAHD